VPRASLHLSLIAALALVAIAPTAALAADAPQSPDPVRASVTRAQNLGAVPPERAGEFLEVYATALRRVQRLDGLRKRELRAVISLTRDIARRRALTASRMPAAFLTLRRNTEWWSTRGAPTAGSPGEKAARGRVCQPFRVKAHASRVTFPGSRVVFQYYPGLGLQIQVLATFATAQAQLSLANAAGDSAALEALDEMVPLVSDRGGLTAWEYFFPFSGAKAPWTSTISQATAVRALVTAGTRLNRPDLVSLAQRAVKVFEVPAPLGVRVPLAKDGNWYVLYSFAPGLRVLNAHLQTLNGLHDVAELTGDARAGRLYREGLRAARRRIGAFDTGRWSKYASPGVEADLNYHVLNRDLARGVCKRSGERSVCDAAVRYTEYLERRCPRAARRRSTAAMTATTAPVMRKRLSVIAAP